MAVRDHQVLPAVVVVVEEGGAPADVGKARRRGPRPEGDIARIVALIAIKRVVLLGEVGDEDAQPAARVVVGDRHAHPALLGAVLAHGNPHEEPRFLEGPALPVDVEVVGGRVVGDVEVEPAVAVHVDPGDAKAEVAVGIADARFLADLGEGAARILAEQEIGGARQAPRSTLDGDAAVLAGLVLAELRQVVQVELDVPANEQVEVAVAVVVGEAATGRPAGGRHAQVLRHVGEGALAGVAVQPVPADPGDVDVLPAVAVDVGDAQPHAPAGMGNTGLGGDVAKRAVAQIAVESARRRLRVVRGVDRERVDEVDVQQAVAVVVEQPDAAAHRLDDVLLLGRRVVAEGDAGGFRDVAEQRRGAGVLGERGRGPEEEGRHRCRGRNSETGASAPDAGQRAGAPSGSSSLLAVADQGSALEPNRGWARRCWMLCSIAA